MSYYNNVVVLFINFGKSDWRMAGQMLPKGSIPIAVINYHNGSIVQIVNDLSKEEIINFANSLRKSVLHQIHQPEQNTDYFPPENGWEYIES